MIVVWFVAIILRRTLTILRSIAVVVRAILVIIWSLHLVVWALWWALQLLARTVFVDIVVWLVSLFIVTQVDVDVYIAYVNTLGAAIV